MTLRKLFTPGLLYFWLIVAFLYIPIILLGIFSFNDSLMLVFPLKGFTLKWYVALTQSEELLKALLNSLIVGLVSSLVVTTIGTLASIGIVRFRFPGRGIFLSVASLPLVIPYVVLGVALLILFSSINIPLSLLTIGIGHFIISLPYVILVVTARLAGFSPTLEEASMDLGANYWETLWRVVIPVCKPAIVAAFLTSFTTSFDEFAVSFFLAGNEVTLPIYLYSQLRYPAALPVIVTLAAIIMTTSTIVIVLSERLRREG